MSDMLEIRRGCRVLLVDVAVTQRVGRSYCVLALRRRGLPQTYFESKQSAENFLKST